MGKFSTQVESLKEQTDLLRNNLTTVTGIDCSNKSIGQCALVALEKTNTDYVDPEVEEDYGYIRPSWYPNIKEILNQATPLILDGTTYYPAYIVLTSAIVVEETFYKTTNISTTSSANFCRGTGCDAYLFSDVLNNNINNQSAELLEVSTGTLNHTWNILNDIGNIYNEKETKVRWFIGYTKSKTTAITVCPGNRTYIELVTGEVTLSPTGSFNNSYISNDIGDASIKYIYMQDNTNLTYLETSTENYVEKFDSYKYLEEVRFPKNFTKITHKSSKSGTLFNQCSSLKKVIFENLIEISTVSMFDGCHLIKNIEFPNSLTTVISPNFCNNCYNLKNIQFPETLTSITCETSFLTGCRNLKYFKFPSNLQYLKIKKGFENCSNLKYIYIPKEIAFFETSDWCSGCFNVQNILPDKISTAVLSKILVTPNNLKNARMPYIENSSQNFTFCPRNNYIELYNDFDVSGVILGKSVSAYYTGPEKSVEWLKNLCFWLKDKTGETSNTMVLYSKNINTAENIWLTYDVNNKRDITFDGVSAETEGAISILEYLTNQLNWTIS